MSYLSFNLKEKNILWEHMGNILYIIVLIAPIKGLEEKYIGFLGYKK